MSNIAFKIKTLKCAYKDADNEKVVFTCDDIEIERGKLTLILGPSGSGKSTFIEALGLMNDTMTSDSEVYFYPPDEDEGILISKIWEDPSATNPKTWEKGLMKNSSLRNTIRYKYYSFVFQETYLMQNFSALENIALTDLIKPQAESLSRTFWKVINGLVNSLHLKNISFVNPPSSYSGGERQRMAFGRGIFPGKSVLFGDEPTGNLDPHNASEVLKYSKDNIKDDKCGIIVSHSIDLAVEFADQMLVLTPKIDEEGNIVYTIRPEFIYKSEDGVWVDTAGAEWDKNEIKKGISFLLNSKRKKEVTNLLNEIQENNNSLKSIILHHADQEAENHDEQTVEALIKKVIDEVESKKLSGELHQEIRETGYNIDFKPPSSLFKRLGFWKFLIMLPQIITNGFFKWLIKKHLGITKLLKKDLRRLGNDFLDIFIKNELNEFLGRYFPKNFIFVLLIQFLIFYLIGTANGILDFVEKQDKNPFVQVINVSTNFNDIKNRINEIEKEIVFKDYGIDTVTYLQDEMTYFYPVNERPDTLSNSDYYGQFNNFVMVTARSMQPEDKIKDFLLTLPALNPTGTIFDSPDDFSLIVTRNYLKKIGQKDSSFLIVKIEDKENPGRVLYQPLPIRGIVNQLPGDVDLICFDNMFYTIFNGSWALNEGLELWIKMDSALLEGKFKKHLETSFEQINRKRNLQIGKSNSALSSILNPGVTIDTNKIKLIPYKIHNIKDLYSIRPQFIGQLDDNEIESIFHEIITNDSIQKFLTDHNLDISKIQLSHISNLNTTYNIDYNNANIYVSEFRNIFDFSHILTEKVGVRLDMQKIERIRNYKIIETITYLLSFFLIIFSILIILILLSNILSNHLNKIKKNIGLLMAFGVNTRSIYMSIMLMFIVLSLLGGLALSWLVGDHFLVNKNIFESFTGFKLDNFTGFKLNWWTTWLTIVVMIIFNMARFYYIILKVFNNTPGKLLYEKGNKG